MATLLGPAATHPVRHALDPADLGFLGAEATYLVVDVATPPLDDVRRRVAEALQPGSTWARTIDPARRTWTPMAVEDREAWAEALVLPTPAVRGDLEAARRLVREPLGELPFRAFVAPDALLVRFAHVHGDGVGMQALVRRMLGVDEPAVPSVWSAARLERAVLAGALRRPLATAAVVAGHRRPATERYVAKSEAVGDAESVLVSVRDRSPWSRRLLAVRDAHWPGTPFSAVLLVALRRALAQHLPRAPRPGAELLVDLRRYLGPDAPELGNLARGVFVTPRDDDDPAEVGRAIRRDLDRGAPLVSLAASVVLARRPGAARAAEAAIDTVAEGGHGARIALSYLRGLAGELPAAWTPRTSLFTETSPNGPEGLTVVVRDLGGTFSLDASLYPDHLDPDQVRTALDHVVRDPEGLLVRSATATERTR